MTEVDTVVRYEPRGAAQELFRTRASEVAMAGPAGTGKSLACLFRVHLAALNTPGIRCLIVRKTAVSLGATTLVTFEKKVAKHALEAGLLRWFGGSPREAACYRYENGSVIVVGGMDKPEKVLSSEYDLVFADEATELTETDWETLGTRLRNGVLPWQQQIAACNPDRPKHWIKQRSDRGSMRMLHSRHHDNPAYINTDGSLTAKGADYMAKLDALTGVRRLRYRDGIWAAAEGLIYEGWDEAVHLIPRLRSRMRGRGGSSSTLGSRTRSAPSGGPRTRTVGCTCTGRSTGRSASSRTTPGTSSAWSPTTTVSGPSRTRAR